MEAFTDFLRRTSAFFQEKGKVTVLSRRAASALPNRMTGNDVLVEIGPGGRSLRIHVLFDGRFRVIARRTPGLGELKLRTGG
jgi:hypothetical protein